MAKGVRVSDGGDVWERDNKSWNTNVKGGVCQSGKGGRSVGWWGCLGER